MYRNIKYFEGLNALRFVAAYLVVMYHAEDIRSKYDLFSLKEHSIFHNGGLAVTFFFVLSGFLITYLLMLERKKTGRISIRKFYLRRVLRIWPLYFLLVLIGTLIVPFVLGMINYEHDFPYTFGEVIWYYVFFMPFMVNIFYGNHLIEPLWSIGVEELFYIMWAPLFKFFKKYVLQIIIAIIVIKISLNILDHLLDFGYVTGRVLLMLQFEAMAIGGIGAYFLYRQEKDISNYFIFSPAFQVFMYAFLFCRLFIYKLLMEQSVIFEWLYDSPVFSDLLMMLAFLWMILNTSLNKRAIVTFKGKILNYLGDISYGIYMYHVIIIFGVVLVMTDFLNRMDPITSTIVYYTVLTSLVILVSGISKKVFEDPFLKLKSKFSNI